MEQCRDELYSLLQQEKLSGASLLIFANKQDLFDAMSAEEIVSALGLRTHDAFSGRHWSIYACSAVEGEGLVEGIDWLVAGVCAASADVGGSWNSLNIKNSSNIDTLTLTLMEFNYYTNVDILFWLLLLLLQLFLHMF